MVAESSSHLSPPSRNNAIFSGDAIRTSHHKPCKSPNRALVHQRSWITRPGARKGIHMSPQTANSSTWMTAFRNRIRRLLRSGPVYVASKETWNSQYRRNHWDYLREMPELAHYSVIAGYFQYLKCRGALLDVGCGEGVLQERLTPDSYSRYVGIDISDEAIRRASHRQDEKTDFIRADLRAYVPTMLFDAIVFCEVLYYFDDALRLLQHYQQFLKQDGVVLVSMYVSEEANPIWRALETKFLPVDETQVSNKSGTSWICKVYSRQEETTRSRQTHKS